MNSVNKVSEFLEGGMVLFPESWIPKGLRRLYLSQPVLGPQDPWLNSILDLLPTPFFLLNFNEKRVSYSNAAARRILGIDYETHPASMSYGKLFSLFDTNGSLIAPQNLPSARVLNGEKIDGEVFLLKSLSGEFSIRVFSENIPAMPGRQASALIVFQDLTSLRATEDSFRKTLEEAREAAERANSTKSQFLANMSHEIRTPLGAIMGFSELIKDPKLGRFEREEYISVIERNSAQLMRIVDDILDLSKVEAGMMLIENIQFSLQEALSEFSSLMEFKAQEKGIFFKSKATTPLPSTIICDPTRLRQILMNVVGNAIKFTDVGHVELRVGYVEGHLDFEIEDTGRGISSEQEVHLFKAFTQADASTTRQYGGTGLGLALTRNLAQALGGHFLLKKSEVGRGSVFAFHIKANALRDDKVFSDLRFNSSPASPGTPAGKLSEVRILLVEDSPDNQALISIFLNRAGAQVDIASDGQQGVNMALAGEYELILMDVQMPIMDGFGAVKELRSKNYQKPIVALTAHAMKEERDRCLGAGFSDFISKPINREDLVNKILSHRLKAANSL